MKNTLRFLTIGIVVAVILTISPLQPLNPMYPSAVQADGYISFEDGADEQTIRSTIPGLQFTTTAGYDWVYGDVRTGKYNGPYPDCPYGHPDPNFCGYSLNGFVFAWLGPNQGQGRIDFTQADATYISVSTSHASTLHMDGYNSSGDLIVSAEAPGSTLETGRLDTLTIQAPEDEKLAYVLIYDSGNQWLIDDLSTDAGGVPDTRVPLIFIPGIMGSRLDNHAGEVWPNTGELIFDRDDDSLLVLQLQADGVTPLEPDNEDFSTVEQGGVILSAGQDVYGSLIEYLGTRGYQGSQKTLYVFPYDWRKDNIGHVESLHQLILEIKQETGAQKVNILAHSMGGLIARTYIGDPAKAANVEKLVTLGTPYLGSPLAFDVMHFGHECMIKWGLCFTNRETMRTLVQNHPSAYQLMPSPNYFKVYPNGHLNMDRDLTGDDIPEGWLPYSGVKEILRSAHNSQLTLNAEDLHSRVASYNGGTNGVKVYAFVGDQQDTPGTVREYLKKKWYQFGFGEANQVEYDYVPTNGDGTVPLHSADLGRGLGVNDFSGQEDVSFFYAALGHGDLAKFNEEATVLRLVADILETAGPIDSYDTSISATSRAGEEMALTTVQSVRQAARIPILGEPTPLTGYQILVQGSALLEVMDNEGNIIRLNEDGAVEASIVGGNLYRIGQTISIFVREEKPYDVKVFGEAEDTVDLRVRTIISDVLTQTILYKDVQVVSDTVAHLDYDLTGAPTYELQIDFDGDGVPESTQLPDAVLDQEASSDTTGPTTTITVETQDALLQVTLTALDNPGGSGVHSVEYSLDEGRTTHIYTGTFVIDPAKVSKIYAKAIDLAGNEEFPLVEYPHASDRLFLPLLQREQSESNLIPLTGNQGNNHTGSFSPDGTQVVFISDRDGNNEVYIMNVDGTEQHRLTQTPDIEEDLPSFSPDASQIIFSEFYGVDDNALAEDLYLMNIDGSQRRNLTNTPDINEGRPRFSHNGTLITFDSDQTGNWEIYTAELQNGQLVNVQQVTNRPAFDDRLPSFSSTGSHILFRAEEVGQGIESSRIYVLELSSGSITKVSGDDADWFPAWSPDDQWIAFSSSRGTANRGLYMMRANGSNTRLLTAIETNDHPAISPDSSKLLFASNREGSFDLYLLDLHLPPVANCVSDEFSNSSLSPDWTWTDPLGDSSYSLTDNPGSLRIEAPDGDRDLNAVFDYNAPRIMQAVSGDFDVTTKVTIDPDHVFQSAGLVAWFDEGNFVWVGRSVHDEIIRLVFQDSQQLSGQGVSGIDSTTVHLRIVRVGSTLSLYYSLDGVGWIFLISNTYPAAPSNALVGLFLINAHQDNPISADFDYFRCGGE